MCKSRPDATQVLWGLICYPLAYFPKRKRFCTIMLPENLLLYNKKHERIFEGPICCVSILKVFFFFICIHIDLQAATKIFRCNVVKGCIFDCTFRILLLFPFSSFDRYFPDHLIFSCCSKIRVRRFKSRQNT